MTGRFGFSLPSSAGQVARIDAVNVSVLVVDDDAGFRGLAVRILGAGGLQVVGEADTAAGGMAAALTLRPDAVLLDVRLPDGDGISLGREIAALAWEPRVVLISSEVDVELATGDGGPLAFVAKADLPQARLLELLSGR
jgi:DNA-binding NarL/FixJ family response regulator